MVGGHWCVVEYWRVFLLPLIRIALCIYFHKAIEASMFDNYKLYIYQLSSVSQSCLTLCDPIDCGPPGSSVHGVFQARILEWVAISFSRGSSQPRD